MKSIRQTQKKYCSRAITFGIFAGFFFVLMGESSIGKGLVLGTLFSIVNFVLMGETLPMKIGKSRGKIYMASFALIGVRYILFAIPLVAAIKFEQFNLFAAIAGIFMIQVVIISDPVLKKILSISRKKV